MNTISIYFNSYIDYLKYQKKYSLHTLRAYLFELESFNEFISKTGISWKELHPKDISVWLSYLSQQKLAPCSIARNLSVLRSFCDYLVSENYLDSNPMQLFSAPKSKKNIPTTLSPKEMIELLFQMPNQTILERRNQCILLVMYTTGMRAEEICDLSLRRLFLKQNKIVVLGKGNKERVIPLIPIACEYINRWLDEREKLDIFKEDYLFLSKNGRKLTTNMIGKIINNVCSMQHKKFHPHAFRYTFATHLLDNNANLRYIQELLGHANLSVTQRYTKISISNLKQKFQQFHPRG